MRSGWLNQIPLLTGALPWTLLVLGVLSLAWLLWGGRSFLLHTVPWLAAAATGLTLLLWWLAEGIFHWWDISLPRYFYFVAALVYLAFLLAVPRARRAGTVRARPLAAAAVVLVVCAAAAQLNVYFGQYPTLASALGRGVEYSGELPDPPAGTAAAPVTEGSWTPPAGMPAAGNEYEATIPGTVSGYAADSVKIYLPPAYLAAPGAADLPVLVLVHGLPGGSADWLTGGQLANVMDAFAARHHGLAPIVVMPDLTGGAGKPPLCLDSAAGKSATYLAVDLPAWVKSRLGVGLGGAGPWAIGGFSYGGTCAMQLATNHPEVYPIFLDISGELEPAPPSGAVVADYFGGDPELFAAQNAMDLLAARNYPDSRGIIVIGAQDSLYGPQGTAVYEAARAAGMDVQLQRLPGGHTWQVWKPGLADNLDWLTKAMGLIP